MEDDEVKWHFFQEIFKTWAMIRFFRKDVHELQEIKFTKRELQIICVCKRVKNMFQFSFTCCKNDFMLRPPTHTFIAIFFYTLD